MILELEVLEALRTLRRHVGTSSDEESHEAIALVAEFVESQVACYHCKGVLMTLRGHCESCPEECDVEECQAEGCVEERNKERDR